MKQLLINAMHSEISKPRPKRHYATRQATLLYKSFKIRPEIKNQERDIKTLPETR